MFAIPSFFGFNKAGFVDPDAAAFFARVTAAGGTLSATEQTAVNTLVVTMKADGTWTPMKAIYPMVGASAAACAQNLKSSSFTGTFTSGWTFASTGATPNGTSAYMDTGLNLSTQTTLYNVAYTNYIRTLSSQGIDMGVTDSSSPPYTREGWFSSNYSGFLQGGFYNNDDGLSSIKVATTDSRGFFIDSMTSSTNAFITQQNVSKGTNTVLNISTPANTTIVLGGVKNATGGSVIEYSNKQTCFVSISDGLTNTQASNFYTAVQAFQTTLSRNV
jgi:hypothetical protein